MEKKEWYEEIAELDDVARYNYIGNLYESLLKSFKDNLNLLFVKVLSYASSVLKDYNEDSYLKLRDFTYDFCNGSVFAKAEKEDWDEYFDQSLYDEVSITETNIREVFSNFITPEVDYDNRADILCLYTAFITVDGVIDNKKFDLLNTKYFVEFKEVLNLL